MRRTEKAVTVKDVLYALQFAGERLLRTHQMDERRNNGIAFTLSKSGLPVPPKVAQTVMQSEHIAPCEDGLFIGHTQQYEWRD